MRCPDCNKFVGMENEDPEVDQLEVCFMDGCIVLNAHVINHRNCSECGTQLKELTIDFEEVEVALEKFDGWDKLSKEQQTWLKDQLLEEEITPAIEEESAEVDEAGGGRFKKNVLTTTLSYLITIEWTDDAGKKTTLAYHGTLTSDNAAGEYEECC